MGISGLLYTFQVKGVVLSLLMCVLLVAFDRPVDIFARQMPPPPVVVVPVAPSDTVVYRDYPARIHGSRQVQVRARVPGILEKRQHEEGAAVEKDDVLFEIDPEPFEIAFQRAEAELAVARAYYRHAERQWSRYSSLHAQELVSERDHDQAETDYALAQARMALADAVTADARRNLRYTKVQAPLAGVTGMESLSEGNLIEAGQLLTTITRQDPVHVRFALPEKDAILQRTAREGLACPDGKAHHCEATLILPDGTEYDQKGEIDFTASTIDPDTGTVMARAVFPNPQKMLVPGQFVRIRIRLEELADVFFIPESAVSRDREGFRIFVVDDDDIAHARTVRIGPVINGRQAVVEGLEAGERVVVSGHVALRDGMKVSVPAPEGGPSGEEAR